MELGLIGLGKMGGNMRTRLRNAGHTVIGYDRNPEVSDAGSRSTSSSRLATSRVSGLRAYPRTVWPALRRRSRMLPPILPRPMRPISI